MSHTRAMRTLIHVMTILGEFGPLVSSVWGAAQGAVTADGVEFYLPELPKNVSPCKWKPHAKPLFTAFSEFYEKNVRLHAAGKFDMFSFRLEVCPTDSSVPFPAQPCSVPPGRWCRSSRMSAPKGAAIPPPATCWSAGRTSWAPPPPAAWSSQSASASSDTWRWERRCRRYQQGAVRAVNMDTCWGNGSL